MLPRRTGRRLAVNEEQSEWDAFMAIANSTHEPATWETWEDILDNTESEDAEPIPALEPEP
jgi:hypothetical protein